MKHPFQAIAVSSKHVFAASKNSLHAYNFDNGKLALVKTWTDETDREQVLRQQQAQKLKDGEKPPKLAVAGPGAPPVYNFIRTVEVFADKWLVCTTDVDKSVIVFELTDDVWRLVRRQNFPKRPNSVTMTQDGIVLVGDKFGDVYSMDPSVEMADFEPILGHVSMLTAVTYATHNGKQFVISSDRDEHIRVTNYPTTYVIDKWLFGHTEFVSSLTVPQVHPELLVSGGGDSFFCVWNWVSGELLQKIDYTQQLQALVDSGELSAETSPLLFNEGKLFELCVNGIVSLNDTIVVSVEGSPIALVYEFKDGQLQFAHSIKHSEPVIAIAVGPQGTLAVASDSEKLYIDGLGSQVESTPENITDISEQSAKIPLYTTSQLRKRSKF